MAMDDELRQSFAELRAREAAEAPSLDAVLARARRPGRGGQRVARAAVAVAAILLLGLWPGSTHHDVAGPSILQWRAPTDVLLRTPGRALLTELPALDRSILSLERSP
jgi:hypothetical protein